MLQRTLILDIACVGSRMCQPVSVQSALAAGRRDLKAAGVEDDPARLEVQDDPALPGQMATRLGQGRRPTLSPSEVYRFEPRATLLVPSGQMDMLTLKSLRARSHSMLTAVYQRGQRRT